MKPPYPFPGLGQSDIYNKVHAEYMDLYRATETWLPRTRKVKQHEKQLQEEMKYFGDYRDT